MAESYCVPWEGTDNTILQIVSALAKLEHRDVRRTRELVRSRNIVESRRPHPYPRWLSLSRNRRFGEYGLLPKGVAVAPAEVNE